jgi:hypothetical protein
MATTWQACVLWPIWRRVDNACSRVDRRLLPIGGAELGRDFGGSAGPGGLAAVEDAGFEAVEVVGGSGHRSGCARHGDSSAAVHEVVVFPRGDGVRVSLTGFDGAGQPLL